MENLKLSIKHVLGFVDKARIDALDPIASDAVGKLENGMRRQKFSKKACLKLF